MQDADDYQAILPGRQAGVGLHLTSLPGQYGIGEIGQEACRYIDFMQRAGLSVWQFLPLGPTGYGDSPYQSLSTFAGNEMLIGIGELQQASLLRASETDALTRLPTHCVEFDRLIPLKSALLMTAARRFSSVADGAMKSAFDRFRQQHDERWLHDYALFRLLKARHNEHAWPEWPAELARHDDRAIRRVEREAALEIEQIKVLQFLFFEQWARLRQYAHDNGVRLFGDMPLFIALDSADAWADREIVRMDAHGKMDHVAGVPPDYFSEDGQLWGNPLYNWELQRDTGFQWWIDRLGATTALADIVRIDHFRGFESHWAIPADADTARTGAWEPGVGDEVFNALKQSLGVLPVVAENLGVITPEVEALRERHGIPGMVVLQFKLAEAEFELADVPENSVCYTGTHDNDTTLGWFCGGPDDTRSDQDVHDHRAKALAVSGSHADDIPWSLIQAAFSTPARLAVAPMQDFLGLGSEARFNIPGTRSNNWRWRCQSEQIDDAICDQIAALVDNTGRSTQ